MTFDARIVCDSRSDDGVRLTTMSLKYPRFIHAEFMTHRMFSRNASSSRAIPVNKIIQQVIDDPAMPVHWGSNKPGMQAGEEIPEKFEAQDYWYAARNEAVKQARKMVDLGLHKQIVNRLLEPWHHIQVVVTATDWNNFFNLRCHPDAQPEMRTLAEHMRDAYHAYDAKPTPEGGYFDWHLPYVRDDERFDDRYSLADLVKLSVARCARVSFMNHDGTNPDAVKDIGLHDQLLTSGHMSPFEHQAYPAKLPDQYHGNFRGWVQYRKTLQGENRTLYVPD